MYSTSNTCTRQATHALDKQHMYSTTNTCTRQATHVLDKQHMYSTTNKCTRQWKRRLTTRQRQRSSATLGAGGRVRNSSKTRAASWWCCQPTWRSSGTKVRSHDLSLTLPVPVSTPVFYARLHHMVLSGCTTVIFWRWLDLREVGVQALNWYQCYQLVLDWNV